MFFTRCFNQQKNLYYTTAFLKKLLTNFFRVLNLYYTVVAEEKTVKHAQMNASIFSRSGTLIPTTFMSPKNKIDSRESTLTNNIFGPGTMSSRTNNLSFLVGTSIHMNCPTSFLLSQTLRNLEPIIQSAYKTFIVGNYK